MSRKRNTTRQLMGIDALTGYSIATANGELVFYIISPTNIGVLPESSITARVNALLGVLKGQSEMEMMALNSRESFEANKSFYRSQMEREPLPAIRKLLELDSQHLDNIQVMLATAREFYLVIRFREQPETDVLRYLSTVEQRIKNHGFTTRRATRNDLKRMLSIYFEQNVTHESLEDYDGQRWSEEHRKEEIPIGKKKKAGAHQSGRKKKRLH